MNDSDLHSRKPVLGCIADDVTGATDLALNLVHGKMRVVQLLGVPDAEILDRLSGFDAVVIALKTRSIPKHEAIQQSLQALETLRSLGVERFYFKYCSTFDSTEQGNIGPVAEALMQWLGVSQTIYCPAFPRAGRTVYQGHLFVGDKLLSESGMQNHPLNPMTDSNLVRFLSKQVTGTVGLLSHHRITQGARSVKETIATLQKDGVEHVITDTCNDSELDAIAEVVASMKLVTGGSGLARSLGCWYRASGMLASDEFEPELPQVVGRGAIIAGSCSTATQSQVRWMQDKCPSWIVDVAGVMEDAPGELEKFKAWALAIDPNLPLLVASTANPHQVAELQDRFGVEQVASAIEGFLAATASFLTEQMDVRQLILAGGETSGAIAGELNVKALNIGPEICAGVPWTETIGREPGLALALKSGNFGDEDFFASAMARLA